jgi:hypothetical protein
VQTKHWSSDGIARRPDSHQISPEPGRANSPAALPVDAPIVTTGSETEPRAFEIAVFNFLLTQKEPLGISAVWRCRNVRIDGVLDLADGRRIALEIKYRMNWEKACQACTQFGCYRTHVEAKEKRLSSGLVVVESFTRDWARKRPKRLLENGWSFFYTTTARWKGYASISCASATDAWSRSRARSPPPVLRRRRSALDQPPSTHKVPERDVERVGGARLTSALELGSSPAPTRSQGVHTFLLLQLRRERVR